MYMYHADGPPCILGRYRLLGRTMGKGNYARVEEAVHLDVDNAHVAVKMIDTHTVKDPYVLRHLEREAKVLQQLRHPNIMAIFEVLRAGSHYCMVTEPLYGGELCTHVNRQPRGHLDEATTLVYGAQLLSAVAHMHALNVVHRDLKTKNIMLSKRGDQVKIVDFGLGRTWSRTRPLLTHCGSPGYAAPEIYQRDRPYGPEVDLWSLGVVLYYMAVGRMPFPPCRDKGRTAEERRRRLVAMITKGATDHHVKLMGHFSPEFRDLVQGLLTASVARRMTLQQAIQHPWAANRLRARQLLNIPYKLSSQERALVLAKVAILLKSTVQSIEAQWRQNRLGEVAAMCNILAHKQLSTYHASWALRPASPKRPGLMGAASNQGAYVPKGPPGSRAPPQSHPGPGPGPSAEWGEAGGVVDQPPSSAYEGGDDGDDDNNSAATVISLGSEHDQAALPPPHRPLALLHAPQEQEDDQDDDDDDDDQEEDEAGSMTESEIAEAVMENDPTEDPTTKTETKTAEAVARAGDVEEGVDAADKVEGTGQEAECGTKEERGTKVDGYVVGCLLSDASGQERLQPLPETQVMYYTETILDNIHATMAPAKHKEVCTATAGTNSAAAPTTLPVKSALASQTGLTARTRKAVSFSIITTAQSADSVVLEERRETGVQANLGRPYTLSAAPAGDRASAGTSPQSATSAAEVSVESKGVQMEQTVLTQSTASPQNVGSADSAGATSLKENVCSAPSFPKVDSSQTDKQCPKPSIQDIRCDNRAAAAKFLNTVPLSRKVSPEPKKNIYEARRWPFRSPRLVYQRMKSQSRLSVAYLLDNQENLMKETDKKVQRGSALSTAHVNPKVLSAHQEESGEDDTIATHLLHEIQMQGNVIQKGNPINKPKETGNNDVSASESGAHAADNIESLHRDGPDTKGPFQTVAEMVRTKLGTVKEKKMDKSQNEKAQQRAAPKEKRSSPARYRRFFPNRYRVDLALVMTLERSRKLILPSMHSPWTPPKSDK